MKTTTALQSAAVVLAFLFAFSSATGDLTNRWSFSDAINYEVSNPDDIEVADGVAKLRFHHSLESVGDVADYLSDAAGTDGLSMGSDIGLRLSQTNGAYYLQGTFTSRIMEGGPGNTWNNLRVKAYNELLPNAGGEMTTLTDGLVFLAHMNDESWIDVISSKNGTPSSSPGFDADAILGSHSGVFDGNDVVRWYDGDYGSGKALTFCFWYRASDVDGAGGGPNIAKAILLGSSYLSFWLGGTVFGHTECIGVALLADYNYIVTEAGTFTEETDENQWRHIAYTYDSDATEPSHIYKDGIEVPLAKSEISGPLPALGQMNLGGSGSAGIEGNMDEVALFDRALSAQEVWEIYTMPKSLLLQVRSGTDRTNILSKSFVGPNGDPGAYYGNRPQGFDNSEDFVRLDHYVQYQLTFLTPSDASDTPYIDAIGFEGTRALVFDNVYGDFLQGELPVEMETFPGNHDTPYVGLRKKQNGGYETSGSYVSKVMDGGASVFWDTLRWTGPAEQSIAVDGLVGLWRMNGGFTDNSGNGNNPASIPDNPKDMGYSPNAKLGTESAIFNGSSSYVALDLGDATIQAVEFWVNAYDPSDGILEFSEERYIAQSNSLITAVGWPGNAPEVYVNGASTSRRLQPGWNHVALIFPYSFGVSNYVYVGRGGGNTLNGMMDELTMYDRTIYGSDVKEHFVAGGRFSAGNVKFQVRADNVNPPETSFIGPGNEASKFFTAKEATLPSDVWQKRYFQYKIYMDSDGDASPAVTSVEIDYSGSGLGTIKDNTAAALQEGLQEDGVAIVVGDEIFLPDLAVEPGLVNLDAVLAVSLEGLWHMDESEWPPGSSVIDSSPTGRHGDPQNGASPTPTPKVGDACGLFDGVDQYLILPSITLDGDFTVSAWFRTESSSRCAVLSRADGSFTLEVNGDGNVEQPGEAAFVVNAGSRIVAEGSIGNLNDGAWHNIAGVRDGDAIYIYVDGVSVGSAFLGTGAPGLGLAQMYVARHQEMGGYLDGNVDEVMVFSRALSGFEINENLATGTETKSPRTYVSGVIDAGGPAIWSSISWSENGPYGIPLAITDGDIVGLWHLDETNGTTYADESPAGNHGDAEGSPGRGEGQFNTCLSLDGSGDGVEIPDSETLEPGSLTVAAWVYMNQVDNRTIFDKGDGTRGYVLATDGNAKPYIWVAGTTCKARTGIRSHSWNHVAGVLEGDRLSIYINGRITGATSLDAPPSDPMNAGPARIGLPQSLGTAFDGLIDEVVVYSRALGVEEIVDLARTGFGLLGFQVRAGDTSDLTGISFVGPDGTDESYFRVSSGSDMIDSVPLGRYAQYRAVIEAEDGRLAPRLRGVTVKHSRYSSDNPWVKPVEGYGADFLGKILGFSHVMETNTEDAVRYQISGSETNWYWWNGSDWEEDTADIGWGKANTASEINAHIDSFYKEHYDKVGGLLTFKAYLHSEGNDQTAIDEVASTYSKGRITILEPNGEERNEKAWLIDTDYTIRWDSEGSIGSNLRLEFSRNSGQSWTTISSGEEDDGVYEGWTTPQAPSETMLVRITDMDDTSIQDESDNTFHLVDDFQVKVPNSNEFWYLTETNNIRWIAPGPAAAFGTQVDIKYAADGSTFDHTITNFAPSVEGSHGNVHPWKVVPGKLPMPLPSLNGRIRVHAADQDDPQFNGQDDSDYTFTLAGITVVNPTEGSYVNNGKEVDLTWVSAVAGSEVALDYSPDDGQTWTNVIPSLPNVDGENHYSWIIDLDPSDIARIQLRSPTNDKIYGVSAGFQVADIRVTAPVSTNMWELRTEKVIRWLSGGAGDWVDLYYSVDNGVNWSVIDSNVVNVASNAFTWEVEPFPSGEAQIRVVSQADPTNLWDASDNFSIAGVRMAYPEGGEIWPMGGVDAIHWEYEDAGSEGAIYTSIDEGNTWELLGVRGLALQSINWKPDYPSARALARIVATNAPDWAVDMQDVSDGYFTVGGVIVSAPTNGSLFTIGDNESISWTSAGAETSSGDESAQIYYTTTGGSDSNAIIVVGNNEVYPGGNNFSWTIPDDVIPSETAQIIVEAGPFRGISDEFVLRGIRITTPAEDQVVDIGGQIDVLWDSAGLHSTAAGYLFLSVDGGQNFDGAALNPDPIGVSVGFFRWDVPDYTVPSTNAVIKFLVSTSAVPEDVSYEVRSREFILRGLKVMEPRLGTEWAHGSSNQIHLVASHAGDFASIYYSADGVEYDDENLVVENWSLSDGDSFVPWTVEYSRLPSTNARLRAVSTIADTVSEPFTVSGVKVTRPIATDIWASGETNKITWTGVGTDGSYDIDALLPGGGKIDIASGVTDEFYVWSVDALAAGTGVVIRVTDTSSAAGDSDPFLVVEEPTIIVINPAPGDLWPVSDTFNVSWAKGGQMTNDFTVWISRSPYTSTTEVFTGSASYDSAANTFNVPWSVEDWLGEAKVLVQHNTKPNIKDESDPFFIVGKFRINYPNGGETLFSGRAISVSWFTEGSITDVNLWYSTDPLHEEDSWKLVDDDPIPNTGQGTVLNTHTWKVNDLGGDIDTVRLRISQYGEPGAYDDSDEDFSVNYYEITWYVVDDQTSQNLDKLSVTESHGESDSDQVSPLLRKYPYGRYDTVWSREFFYDKVVFNWEADSSKSIEVRMKQSEEEPDYNVMADFTYEGGDDDKLTIHSWLERAGGVLTDPADCTVYIYDSDGSSVSNLWSDKVYGETGVFRFEWNNVTDVLDRNSTYFARVEIEYSGSTYASVITYTLHLSADDIQTEELVETLGSVDTNLSDLANAIYPFISDTEQTLSNIESNTAGLEGLSGIVSNLADVVPTLESLTNELVGVVGIVSNTHEAVVGLEAQIEDRSARILTLESTVARGSTHTILYKTKPGHSGANPLCTIEAWNREGTVQRHSGTMDEIVPGIYQEDIEVDWPVGYYVITCSDPDGSAQASVPLRVVSGDIYDLPTMMVTVSNDLAKMDQKLAGIDDGLSGVTNAASQLDQLIQDLSALTNLDALATAIEDFDTDALTNLTALTDNIDSIQDGVVDIQASLGALTNLDDIVDSIAQLDVDTLTNLNALAEDVQNIMGVVSSLDSESSVISNAVMDLNTAFNDIKWSALTNVESGVEGIQAQLGALTNLDDIATAIEDIDVDALTNISALATDINDIQNSVGGIGSAVGVLSNSVVEMRAELSGLGDISNLVAAVDTLSQSGISNMADLAEDVALVEAGVGRLTNDITEMKADLSAVETAMGDLDLTGLEDVGEMNTNLLGLISAQQGFRTTMAGDLADLSDDQQAFRTSTSSDLTQVGDDTGFIRSNMGTSSGVEGSLRSLESDLASVVGTLGDVDSAIGTIGDDADDAQQRAQTAKKKAQEAATGVEELKQELASGNLEGAYQILKNIRNSLQEARLGVEQVSEDLTPAQYHDQMLKMAKTVQDIASREGYENFLKLEALTEEGGVPGEGPDKKTIGDLSLSIQEMKGSMQLLQRLIDEKLYEPQVQETLMGVE